MRPWKTTLLVPLCPIKDSVPRVTVRAQVLCLAFLRLLAAHLRPTLRPAKRCVKANLTAAGWLSVKERVVPIGRFLLLTRASLRPRRHVEADWRAAVIVG